MTISPLRSGMEMFATLVVSLAVQACFYTLCLSNLTR